MDIFDKKAFLFKYILIQLDVIINYIVLTSVHLE